MAKRKPFHAQMAAVVARDMRPFFSMEEIKNSLFEQELPGIGLCESGTSFLGARFLTLQEEAHFISSFEQSHTITDDDPLPCLVARVFALALGENGQLEITDHKTEPHALFQSALAKRAHYVVLSFQTKGAPMKKALTGIAFAASCAAGLAAAMYGITVAYFMGSRAQADLDQCTPADPRLLVRSSFQEIMRMAPAAHPSTIAVEDDAIEVNSLN